MLLQFVMPAANMLKGSALILGSFLIFLVFAVSFYNILVKGEKFAFTGSNLIAVPLFLLIMVYLFRWGVTVFRGLPMNHPKIKF